MVEKVNGVDRLEQHRRAIGCNSLTGQHCWPVINPHSEQEKHHGKSTT